MLALQGGRQQYWSKLSGWPRLSQALIGCPFNRNVDWSNVPGGRARRVAHLRLVGEKLRGKVGPHADAGHSAVVYDTFDSALSKRNAWQLPAAVKEIPAHEARIGNFTSEKGRSFQRSALFIRCPAEKERYLRHCSLQSQRHQPRTTAAFFDR